MSLSDNIVIRHIEHGVEQLLERANLRECDMRRFAQITTVSRQIEWLMSKVIVWERLHKHIDYAGNGAPIIDDGYISVSHSAQYIAVLFSVHAPCGIDIESKSRNAAKIARKFTSQNEVEIARILFPANAELLVWCAKEALYKRAGVEGADFRKDFKIDSIINNRLVATAFGKETTLEVEEIGDMLIVYC